MPSHQVTQEGSPDHDKWRLEWDEATFILKDPDGQEIFALDLAQARKVIDSEELFEGRKVTIVAPRGKVTFHGDDAAINDVQAFLEAGLRNDLEYRAKIKGDVRWCLRAGPVFFLVGTLCFILLILVAQRLPEPPPNEAVAQGLVFRCLGFVFLAMSVIGPSMVVYGWRQRRRIRRIEQDLSPELQELC